MDESEFWVQLEYRVCQEIAGLTRPDFRRFWCDGFIPSRYLLDGPQPRITGKAWICNGPAQDEWDFVLVLPNAFGSREEIDWSALLPPKDVTRWMAFDEGRRYIEIDPSVAVPDLR